MTPPVSRLMTVAPLWVGLSFSDEACCTGIPRHNESKHGYGEATEETCYEWPL